MADSNPLIAALPSTAGTDYLTYLTIIEYNLTIENLPTLHNVLQDTELTINIGWDLVHLLVPLLPAADQCLQDVARLGNPREVILKVTESLRLIDYEGLEPDSDDEPAVDGALSDTAKHPIKTAVVDAHDANGSTSITQAVEAPPPTSLPVLQFTSLLSMLSILHPRIKTQYPSRFLSTTLQAILASFSHSVSHQDELISDIVRFVKNVSGMKRPHLPPRKSSTNVLNAVASINVPDPEADATSETSSASEAAMQRRLLQSFVTHILEEYMESLTSDDDVPGLAWCSRLQEKLHAERTIPGKLSMSDRFEKGTFHARLVAVGEILALAQDLDIQSGDLLDALMLIETPVPRTASGDEEADPPTTSADIPLSRTGSLYLFTARQVVATLYSAKVTERTMHIFPDHQRVLSSLVSSSTDLGVSVGTEPEAVLDAVLALAVLAVEVNLVGEPADTEQFNQYLQVLSLISANSPSPTIRYHAYYLTTTILRSNPSEDERLAFIRDTLEHCPFENLKVSAVSWIKGETIEANPPTPTPIQDSLSLFATPIALDTLAPFLFPDLTRELSLAPLMDSWLLVEQNLHLYLASLNFYFLLLTATHLHDPLAIRHLHVKNDITRRFLHPLIAASAKFAQEGKVDGELFRAWSEQGDVDEHMAELNLLDASLERITSAVARLK